MKRYFFFLVVCLCLMAGCREIRQEASDSFSMGNGEENSVLAESDGEGRIAPAGDSETDPDPAQRKEDSLTEEKEIPSPQTVSAGETVEEAFIEEDHSIWFTSSAIDDTVWERIRGVSYPEDCPLSLDELCYLRLLHWDFDGNIRVGEMIVNREIEDAALEIFEELFESGYPIEKIRLIDEYGGDDEASMADNNTSCFNYRPIAGSSKMSAHSEGLAIDLNPLYNPYVKKRDDSTLCRPAAAEAYLDRSADFPGKITKKDPAYRLFTSHGFTWGGSWKTVKDYQHFERRTKP